MTTRHRDARDTAAAPASPPGRDPSAALGSAVLALGAGAVAAATAPAALRLASAASSAWGEDALLLWLAAGLGATCSLVCAHLLVTRALAAIALVAGPHGVLGALSVRALRVLAPRLARRVVASAMMATTITGLALGSAHAQQPRPEPPAASTGAVMLHGVSGADPAVAQDGLTPGAVPPAPAAGSLSARLGTGPDRVAPGAMGPRDAVQATGAVVTERDPAPPEETAPPQETAPRELPPLGWEEPVVPTPAAPTAADAEQTAAPEVEQTAAPDVERSDAPGAPASDAHAAPDVPAGDGPAERLLIVQEGDCLWSIADDLLGPGRDDDSAVAAAWPLLWEANARTIGADPDVIHTGQRLVVPADLPAAPSSDAAGVVTQEKP